MSVSPSSLSRTYKKNSVVPSDNVVVTPSDTSNGPFGDGPWVESKPNWLKVIYVKKEGYNNGAGVPDRVTYRVTVDEAVARTMAAGNYSGNVVFLSKRISSRLNRQSLRYTLEIQDTVVLKVTPN